MNNNYTIKSVQKLEFFDAVRKHPGMYIGSKDAAGLLHLIKELVSNSIDEYLNGACTNIESHLMEDGSFLISDNGRGIPIGMKEDGVSALQMCFTQEHAGGKFLNATGESGYNSTGGMHGLGTKCVNALSDFLEVTSYNSGKTEKIRFEEGSIVEHTIEDSVDNKHGLQVRFKPSAKYLETTIFDEESIKNMLREFSFLCKDLSFTFKSKECEETFLSKNGISDYLSFLNKNEKTICNPFFFEEEEDTFRVEAGFVYNDSYKSDYRLYTNNIPQNKGTHLTGFKTAFTSSMNAFARSKGWLKEKDTNLQGSDFEEGQLLIINFRMIDPVCKGQHKEELSSTEGRTYVQRFTSSALEKLFASREKEVKAIFDKAINARKAREAAKKAKEAVRQPKDKKKIKLTNLPSKLVDANSKDRSACELFIVEGDSAAGNMIAARDPETQAILPIRGKFINLYKNSEEKVFSNQEVQSLGKALGLEMDKKTHKLIYNHKKLRYGKIIPSCDADPDGKAIVNLLLTYFWSMCPELVINGHIWIALPPLFRITKGKDTYIYLKDQAELEEYKMTHIGEKFLINRNKGLGEQDSDELEECLLNNSSRNVVQVVVDDIDEVNKLFDILMGPNVALRREWLLAHSEEASDNLW